MIRRLLLYLNLSLMMVGCGRTPVPLPSAVQVEETWLIASPSVPSVKTLTTMPSPTILPTPTWTGTPVPSPTSTPASIPTVPPEAKLSFHCLEIPPGVTMEAGWRGNLILTPVKQKQGEVVLMDLATGAQTPLSQAENEWLFDFAVSPDHKQFAYRKQVMAQNGRDVLQDWLVVASADGRTVKALPFRIGKWSYFNWLDNQRLVIRLMDFPESMRAGSGSVLVLNPLTGAQRELDIAKYPDKYPLADIGLLWDMIFVYNTTLSRVVYPAQLEDLSPALGLWDLRRDQSIVAIPMDVFGALDQPKWSPDDKRVAFIMTESQHARHFWHNELYLLDQEGQMTRLTYLSEYYEFPRISAFTWSPDGQKIAIWMFATSELTLAVDELAVVDTGTGTATNYCICDKAPTNPLIWSPDGQQLATAILGTEPNSQQVILVDLVREKAFRIAENLEPAGWLVKVEN